MERRTRVYPAERRGSAWMSIAFLGMAALLIATGLVWRDRGSELTVEPLLYATPVPLEERFDETPAKREMVLPAFEWHALQLGAFENEAAAKEQAEQFAMRGAAGYVWHDGRYRVLAAVYPLKEDAQRVRERLQVRHEIDSYLYQIKLPEIHVRLSGMQGQLDILQAALIHGTDLVNALQRMSVSMDRQELNVDEAFAELASLHDQISLVALRLRQRFAAPRHAMADQLLGCLEQFDAFYASLNRSMSQITLGPRLKHQTFEMLSGLKKVYDTLSHT